MLYEKIILDPF